MKLMSGVNISDEWSLHIKRLRRASGLYWAAPTSAYRRSIVRSPAIVRHPTDLDPPSGRGPSTHNRSLGDGELASCRT